MQPRHIGLFPSQVPMYTPGWIEQMWYKILSQGNSSGQGGIRTRDLSIPKPASYH
ncbi:hypothetical protein DPMN_142879 [Dreissena polymorpha]|uniref:Uncharacterized protein n=1 Tax=Dreissena polymorpha TaxID=45954 RepID=A0A9D4JML7_DREPO|nr:hypothetical protein DPMN_142879 [Dreissena polymorpha]